MQLCASLPPLTHEEILPCYLHSDSSLPQLLLASSRAVNFHNRPAGHDHYEMLTTLQTHRWVVPLFWVPALVAAAPWTLQLMDFEPVAWAGCAVSGYFIWGLIEYSLHRWGFHAEPTTYWAIAVHFGLHGAHHKYPMDKMRLVFPLLPAVLIALMILGVIWMVIGQVR